MKKKSLLMLLLSFLVVSGMLLAACGPAETEAPAAVEEEEVVAEEEEEEVVAEEEEEVMEEEEEEVAEEEEEAVVEEEEVMEPKQLVLVETNVYTSLNPFTNAWHATPTFLNFGYGLAALAGDRSEYMGSMAEGWEISDDNLSITISLRDDITFTDGTPVNAEAVKWNYDMYMDEEIASPGGGSIRQYFESVEVLDEFTFKITLVAPWAPLLNELTWSEFASPTAFEELGTDAYSQALTAAGPYYVEEIIPDVHILYKRNDNYNFGPAYCKNQGPYDFDEVLLKYIADDEVIYAALETGEIHLGPIAPQYLQNATTGYFGMNNGFAPFDNIEVRQAIAYAIDRQEVVDIAFEGLNRVNYQPLAAGNLGYNPDLDAYGMATSDDADMAMQMLEDLGYTDSDGDGIRETPDGVPMEYKLQFVAEPTNQRIAEVLQNQLLQIGIATNLTPIDGTMMRETTAAGEHEMFHWMYGMLDPMITTYIFHSARIGASNRNHVNSPELDGLLDVQDQTLDPIARQAAVDDVTRYLIDNRHHVPMYTFIGFTGYRSDILDPQTIDPYGGIWYCDLKMK
jgi:peptide/nickel transport system substrate-binding protein